MDAGLLSFMPGWSHLVPFLLAALALNLTPGADMTYVLSRSLAQGKAAGLASAIGIFTGSVVHTLLAAVGVAALIAASEIAYQVLIWVGAAYLVYLAIKLWREETNLDALQARRPASLTRIWVEGTFVNLFNPKVAVFILAFLPQFTEPARGHVWAQIIVLGTLFNISGTTVNAAVALAAGSLSDHLRQRPGIKRWMNRICATLLGALAVRLVTTSRPG